MVGTATPGFGLFTAPDHRGAVELALAHGIDIHLRSSFSAEAGTWIRHGGGAFEASDGSDVAGIAHRPHENFYSVRGVSAATASSALEQRGAAVGAIVHDGDEVRFTAPWVADTEVVAALSAIPSDWSASEFVSNTLVG